MVVEPGERPVAATKSLAPISRWPANGDPTTGVGGDEGFLAAVAGHDAFWLGFEVEDGAVFAVIVEVDGRNVLTHRERGSDELEHDPTNFLVVPDQPWFDAVVDDGGEFRQLTPRFGGTADTVGAEVRLVVRRIVAGDLEPLAGSQPGGPVPLYSGQQEPATSGQALHPWPGRAPRPGSAPSRPCARLVFWIVEPDRFETLTGVELPVGMFDDESTAPPPPHDPFGV